MFKFSQRSEKNLRDIHPDLVKVAGRALEITKIDFTVTQGLRTKQEQHNL